MMGFAMFAEGNAFLVVSACFTRWEHESTHDWKRMRFIISHDFEEMGLLGFTE
jgi:hypothetical protein